MSANIPLSVADWKKSFSLNFANNNPEENISDANESNNESLTAIGADSDYNHIKF